MILHGRHVLAWLLGFFAVVMVANGAFLYFALRSHPGLGSADAYRRGLQYNRVIEAAEAQRALGWTGTATHGGGRLVVRIADAAGMPVSGLAVEAVVRRPVEARDDVALPLAETGDAYAAPLALRRRGQWDVAVTARRRDGTAFAFETRIRVD